MITRVAFTTAADSDEQIVDMIIAHEGGIYTDHPKDRGGPTKWGITIPVLAAYWGRPVNANDIRQLDRETAEAIYVRRFIRPFDQLERGILRSNAIDMGVNAGVGRSVRLLQQTVGATVDGVLGPQTARLSVARDWNPLFVGVRIAFYEDLIRADASQSIFRNGWRARALSFYGKPRLRLMREDLQPVFGHQGKADYAIAA